MDADASDSRSGGGICCYLQIPLRTLLLVIAAGAVWGAYLLNRWELSRLESDIASMSQMARALRIDDPTQIAVVGLEEFWAGELRWDVWLPIESPLDRGRARYRLALATRNEGSRDFPSKFEEVLLEPGRHRISVEFSGVDRQDGAQEDASVTVLVDGAVVMEDAIPKQFYDSGAYAVAYNYDTSRQFPASARVPFVYSHALPDVPAPNASTIVGMDGTWVWLKKAPAGEGEDDKSPTDPP